MQQMQSIEGSDCYQSAVQYDTCTRPPFNAMAPRHELTPLEHVFVVTALLKNVRRQQSFQQRAFAIAKKSQLPAFSLLLYVHYQ